MGICILIRYPIGCVENVTLPSRRQLAPTAWGTHRPLGPSTCDARHLIAQPTMQEYQFNGSMETVLDAPVGYTCNPMVQWAVVTSIMATGKFGLVSSNARMTPTMQLRILEVSQSTPRWWCSLQLRRLMWRRSSSMSVFRTKSWSSFRRRRACDVSYMLICY